MRLGAIPAALTDPRSPDTIDELRSWVERAGAPPDVAPIWHRLGSWGLGHLPALLHELHEVGITPMLYVESTGVTYRAILDGLLDAELRELAWIARGLRLRWDQEPDGSGLRARWQQPAERALYVPTWQYVHGPFAEEGVRMLWCPADPERALAMGLWPGRDHVELVGFDRFSRRQQGRWPIEQWGPSIAALAELAPGLERWICETGRDASLSRSGAWLAEIPDVPGIAGACIFDMLIGPAGAPPDGDDWRWKPAMYDRWAMIQGVG